MAPPLRALASFTAPPSASGAGDEEVLKAALLAEATAAAAAAAAVGALEEEKDRLCFIADLSFSLPSLSRILSLRAGEPPAGLFFGRKPPLPLLEDENRCREDGAGEQGVEAVNASAGTDPATPPAPVLAWAPR